MRNLRLHSRQPRGGGRRAGFVFVFLFLFVSASRDALRATFEKFIAVKFSKGLIFSFFLQRSTITWIRFLLPQMAVEARCNLDTIRKDH